MESVTSFLDSIRLGRVEVGPKSSLYVILRKSGERLQITSVMLFCCIYWGICKEIHLTAFSPPKVVLFADPLGILMQPWGCHRPVFQSSPVKSVCLGAARCHPNLNPRARVEVKTRTKKRARAKIRPRRVLKAKTPITSKSLQ